MNGNDAGVWAPTPVLLWTNSMATNDTPSDNTDGHDQSTDFESDWESVARDALVQLFFNRKGNLQDSLNTIETGIDTFSESELTAEDIQQFRRDFYDVQRLVEETIVPLIDGVEPYTRATTNLTNGQMEAELTERDAILPSLEEDVDGDN